MPRWSQHDLDKFLLRSNEGVKSNCGFDIPKGREENSEAQLHGKISSWLKDNGILFFHGSTAHRTHRTIGEPDYTIVLQGRVVFAEVKRSPKHKPTPEQTATLAWLKKLGHRAEIVTSIEDIITLCINPIS